MGKKRPGDPLRFSAREWNRFVESSDAYFATKALGDAKRRAAHAGRDTCVVKVKNVSGGDLPRGSVVSFTDYLLDDDQVRQDYLWFDGDTPDLTHPGYGILKVPAQDGKIEEAYIAGACFALVDVTDANHKFARVVSGDTVLQSAYSGPIRLLYRPSGTGSNKECAVFLSFDAPQVYLGKTDSALNKGASGTVSRYGGTPGSETDSGINDTVRNNFANIGSGKWVVYIGVGGFFYTVTAEC